MMTADWVYATRYLEVDVPAGQKTIDALRQKGATVVVTAEAVNHAEIYVVAPDAAVARLVDAYTRRAGYDGKMSVRRAALPA